MANDSRNRPHLYLKNHGESEAFTTAARGGGAKDLPERDRERHAAALARQLERALHESRNIARDPSIAGGIDGCYLEIELPESQLPVLDALENRQGKERIELVAVRSEEGSDKAMATVFMPKSKESSYAKKIRAYRDEETETGKPRHQKFAASMDSIRVAGVRSLYTDDRASLPEPEAMDWWEVWLRTERQDAFRHAADALDMEVLPEKLEFPERTVMLVHANAEKLERVIQNTDAIAELRMARDTPASFVQMPHEDQREWSEELRERVVPPSSDAPSVCILDSGTTRRHPLLRLALAQKDVQAYDPEWNAEDSSIQWRGHGTGMSGLALYGDLLPVLMGNASADLKHRLESVKILPDHGGSSPDLYGHITGSAMSRAEIAAPDRPRAFCLAVTAYGCKSGHPSSWSAELDSLTYGDGADQRLLMVSAGNIEGDIENKNYPNVNDLSPVQNPAQAWNALTVGAYTEKITISDPSLRDYNPLANIGDLSPRSCTSLLWNRTWPIKPDVVFEGGNLGVDPTGKTDDLDDLVLLSTHNYPELRPFATSADTSAATALAARMAAQILADHPRLWPETVRALMVHSSEWTPAMKTHFLDMPEKEGMRNRLRRYGYGVPDLGRALRSMDNDVTLIIEDSIQPFDDSKRPVRTKDMGVHKFIWPADSLEELGDKACTVKVTLSYFIEPNPSERGWTKRHRYASHGLRFDMQRTDENLEDFRARINRQAQHEDWRPGAHPDQGWLLGANLRKQGSIHSDVWQGTAIDLTNRTAIAVYPVGGWWREKPALERADRRARYTLIVSVHVEADVDIYTPIEVAVPAHVEV